MWSRFPREWSCSSLDPLGVLALLPDDLPLDEVGVGRAFHSVNGEFGGGAHTAGRPASREADVAEAGGAAARRRGEGVCRHAQHVDAEHQRDGLRGLSPTHRRVGLRVEVGRNGHACRMCQEAIVIVLFALIHVLSCVHFVALLYTISNKHIT